MKQFKKVLAFVLALAMVVTAVPTADAKAAAKAPKLNNTKKILYVGQSYTLKIGNLPANWKKCTYAWSASNKNVTVKKGKYGQAAKVTAVKKGTATVTVKMTYPQTAAQKKAKKKTVKTFKCVVTVKNPSVKFTTTADRIEVGETAQFTAKATPSTAKVTYSSSDAAVATVDATGLVTAVADGTATIKASAKVGTKTVSASKTVEVYTAPTEAKQTKAKEITITSGKVVTAESKIEVKKGSVEVALDQNAAGKGIAVDPTGKTVVLTTAAKLSKGEYTVTIDGVTANFTAEDEKVASIKFTSDKAVLDAQVSNGGTPAKKIYKTAKAAYKVFNQFNEDITEATTVEVSGTNVELDTKKGYIVFTSNSDDGYRLTDKVSAVVIYRGSDYAVSESGIFDITNEGVVDTITIKDGVYDQKGNPVTITEDTDFSKVKAYVLVSAKDQYNRDVEDLYWDEDPSADPAANVFVSVVGGITNLTTTAKTSEEITVDGVKYAGIKLTKEDGKDLAAGTATVMIISKGKGTTAQGTITVANGGKIDTIKITTSSQIIGGKVSQLGYEALDSYNNSVTKFESFAKLKSGIVAVDTKAEMVAAADKIYAYENPETEVTELYYSAPDNNTKFAEPKTIVVQTETYKTETVNLSVQPNSVPTAIVGTKNLNTAVLADGTETFDFAKANIKVVDQYGLEVPASAIDDSNYAIYYYNANNKAVNHAFANGDSNISELKFGIEDAISLSAAANYKSNVTPAEEQEGTTKIRFVLLASKSGDADPDIDSNVDEKHVISSYDVTFTAVEKEALKTFDTAEIGNVYMGNYSGYATAQTAYDKTLKVYGYTADGLKVHLPDKYYKVSSDADSDQVDLAEDGGKAGDATLTSADLTAKDSGDYLEKADTKEVNVRFTIIHTGDTIDRKATLTKATPVVTTVELTGDSKTNGVLYYGTNNASAVSVGKTDLVAKIVAKDQYGAVADMASNQIPRINISKINTTVAGAANGFTITENGTTNATATVNQLSGKANKTTATVTFTFPGGKEFKAKLYAKVNAGA